MNAPGNFSPAWVWRASHRLAHAATTVNCTASAGGIAFGAYNPLSAVADASTGALRVTCNGSGTGSANVTVNLSR